MFYSQFILAKKGPLGTIWIAAHLERKLRKNQVTETNISVSVDSILFPEVPIALRLSGHLLLGVVRIYSRKVNYLFHDCSEALVKIKQAFHAGAVDLPPEAATAPFHSITLPETFDLDEFEPLPDREMHLLHSNGAADHHVTTREQITLQDPLEDSSYLESQFGLDERFPEGDAPRMGIDFDEDLLDKPSREGSPDAVTLQEDEVLPVNMDEGMDYDQMDRMETMDMDDHHEPGTPALGMDHMDLDYQPEVEVEEMDDGDLNRGPEVIEDLEPDHHSQQIELDNLEPDLNKPDQLEPATPGTLEPEQEEGKGKEILVEEPEREEVQDEEGSAQQEGLDENVQKLDEPDVPAEKGEVEKQEEEEERAGREGEEEVIEEKQEERQEIDNGPEKMLLQDESKADDESKQDVPEYETVMSAVEIPNQEPDVFDLEQDMEREMPSMMFKDQDEYMEDKEPLLMEDRDTNSYNQFVPAEDPTSPVNSSPPLQAFNPDVLPGDDDVLASLLGGGTLALKVIATPAEMAVVVKPRRKQAKRKRKIVMDMNTILPADVMREQLMNTDDIRRVRRKAPCTRQELWSVQKDALGQQIFSVHSVPGLCPELRVLFQRVYVAGGANLPLADDVQAEPELELEPEPGSFGNEVVPEQQEVFPVHDVAGEVHEEPQGAEPHVEPVTEDQEVQGPPHGVFPNEPEIGPEPLDIPVHEAPEGPQDENEARSVDDVREAGNALLMEHNEAYAAEDGTTVGMEENKTTDADHAPAEISKEDEMHLSPTRMMDADKSPSVPLMAVDKSPNIPSEDLSLTDGQENVEEKHEAAEKVDVEIVTLPAAVEVPVEVPEPERQFEAEPEPVPEPELEPGVAVEAVHVADNVSEEMADATRVVMPEPVPEAVPSNVTEDTYVEEHNHFQEELAAPQTDDARVSSPPVQVEEAQPIVEEQPVVEELGFLADARDTVFLAADDDDLCEEAEDFQDGSEYGQKETLVQDNSGWSARTRAVGQYLRSTLESKYTHMRKREEEGIPKLGLEQILVGKSRKEAARMFFETLVLKTKDYIHVEQESPFGNIHISARPKLLKANF